VTESDRHHRQRLLPVVGDAGQEALHDATVFIAGCGALGTVAADLLCRAGVGTLVIVDRDVVELSNLQRQTLYVEADAKRGTPKAEAARLRLGAIDPSVRVRAFVEDIAPDTVESLVEGCDLVLDGLDNFETRYLLNDVAVKHGLPYLYGGAVATGGVTMPVIPRGGAGGSTRIRFTDADATPCLRCVFPEAPPPGTLPTCDTAGVLGSATATIAARLAAEAMKLIVGDLASLDRTLRSTDLWRNEHRAMAVADAFDPSCPCCVARRFEFLDGPVDRVRPLCGRNAVQIRPDRPADLDLEELAGRLAIVGLTELRPGVLDVRLSQERSPTGHAVSLTVFSDGRTIVEGDTDPIWARSVTARILGT
jgi:molybdopterin/thiamine biosynthesis adenylyltransferase